MVNSAPRTGIGTRQLEDRQRGRVTGSEARLSPPSIEQVEHVVDVGRQFKGVAREGWKRLRHTCVEDAEPRIVATVALKDPAALLAQARLGPDEAVEQGIDRVLLGRGAEAGCGAVAVKLDVGAVAGHIDRSEEHTSELQSRLHIVCRLLLEKKKTPCTDTETRRHKKQYLHADETPCPRLRTPSAAPQPAAASGLRPARRRIAAMHPVTSDVE